MHLLGAEPRRCMPVPSRHSNTHSPDAAFALTTQPDLPLRLEKNIPLTVAPRSCYYAYEDPHGYVDFPFASDELRLKN